MRAVSDQPLSRLARLIAARQVVNFTWRSQLLLPVAQFDPVSLSPREGVREVINELGGVYDDAELADWFAQPNQWLDDESPAIVIKRDSRVVIAAARADRFVATC